MFFLELVSSCHVIEMTPGDHVDVFLCLVNTVVLDAGGIS